MIVLRIVPFIVLLMSTTCFSTAQSLPFNPYSPCGNPYVLRSLALNLRDLTALSAYLKHFGLPPACIFQIASLRQQLSQSQHLPLPYTFSPNLHLSSEIGKNPGKGFYNKNELDIPADRYSLLMLEPLKDFKFLNVADLVATEAALASATKKADTKPDSNPKLLDAGLNQVTDLDVNSKLASGQNAAVDLNSLAGLNIAAGLNAAADLNAAAALNAAAGLNAAADLNAVAGLNAAVGLNAATSLNAATNLNAISDLNAITGLNTATSRNIVNNLNFATGSDAVSKITNNLDTARFINAANIQDTNSRLAAGLNAGTNWNNIAGLNGDTKDKNAGSWFTSGLNGAVKDKKSSSWFTSDLNSIAGPGTDPGIGLDLDSDLNFGLGLDSDLKFLSNFKDGLKTAAVLEDNVNDDLNVASLENRDANFVFNSNIPRKSKF